MITTQAVASLPPPLPQPAHDDATLAAALIAREAGAAAQAWRRLSPLVLGLLRRYFGPGADRQDLCQEVFLRFFARIDELRNQAALRSFLVGICLGVAQNELRRIKVRRWISFAPPEDLPDLPTGPSDLEAREATVRFYAILARLSAEDRALFLTRYVEKLEIAEIAELTGHALSTTRRRLARATRRVAAKMSRDPALAEYATAL